MKEKMKEKLIKLINEGHFCWQMGADYDTWEECVADHLLANDVIVQDSTLVEIDQSRGQIPATKRCRKGERH